MLLYVMESKGSSPGRQGFCMAVNARHEMEGSIGGGIMEHKFVEMAVEKLRVMSCELREMSDALRVASIKKQVHDKRSAANQSGMICSGEQTILLYPVNEQNLPVIQQLISSLQEYCNGTLRLSPDGIHFSESIPVADFSFAMTDEQNWLYEEKTGYKNKLFIVGGGHCSLALSRLMASLDFYIHVLDDREHLKTLTENDAAHIKQVVDDYSAIGNLIPSGNNHYVVVMTFGYRTDDITVRSLLKNQYRYLGVMGSKNKMETLFAQYRSEGVEEALLQLIHTPAGLPISSQTPEEIAVSIAAEIIRVKNKPAV